MRTPETLKIFIGFDQREAVAYHACVQSIIDHAKDPNLLEFHPIGGEMRDGSNAFIYKRFEVPYLCGYKGSAVFLDGDMLVRAPIEDLFALQRLDQGVQVVKHDYKTKHPVKYLGNKNEDYERKNWSSVILWNCGFFPNKKLTPELVKNSTGAYLHRFGWLSDQQIGGLPPEWNHLTMEYPERPDAKLYHMTIGTPCFPGYEAQEGGAEWYQVLNRMMAPLAYEK